MINTLELTIIDAKKKLKAGEFTARELTEACIAEIKKHDDKIHAFIEVYDDVLDQADEADKKIKNGEDLPLLGIPVAIKDNILYQGKIATAASKILEGYVASYDSFAVKKLLEAGAVIIGRTNMD